ncbi:MAG: alcohol dehydrogenase catalytic domain-containing protein [Galactobacter sp.]
MKAAVIYDKEDLRIEEVPTPEVEPGKVLLEGGFNGICGSDLHFYYEPDETAAPTGWNLHEPAALTGAQWPQIFGHEFSGKVTAVGEGVTKVKPGDNVAVFPYHFCRECEACLSGRPNLCSKMAFDGIQSPTGGLSEVKLVKEEQCFVLPDGVSLELGALVEPMAVAFHGVMQSQPQDAQCAVVLGGGPIGVGAFFALRTLGIKNIIVSEPSADRRETLKAIGVEHLVDPLSQELAEAVKQINDGVGADVVIDCAGAPVAFQGAIDAMKMGGRLVVIAGYAKPVTFNPGTLGGSKSISNSLIYTPEDFQYVVDGMAAGKYTADGGWISKVSLDQVEETIHQLRKGSGMKVLVDVSQG